MVMFRRSGMRRYRRPMRMNPIQSLKHQFQESTSYVGANANNEVILVVSVPIGDAEAPQFGSVPVGSQIYGIVVSVNYTNATANAGTTYEWFVWKSRSGQTTASEFGGVAAANWSALGGSKARNQIIKSFMGVTGTEDAVALQRTIYIKLPKNMQRVRDGDTIRLIFNSSEPGTLSIGARYKTFK